MQVFDLKIGNRPEIIEKNISGFWSYVDENPIVHIIQSSPRFHQGNDKASEAIDHTGFFMNGYEVFIKKLNNLKINYILMELPDINEKRIFLHTPMGILLETVFRNE